MATFTNKFGKSTISGTTIYTVPVGITSVVLSINITNLIDTSEVVSITVDDTFIAKNVPLPSGSSLDVVANKIILTNSQVLKITSLADHSVDILVSTMEL